jgi:hypothetical protein
VRALSLHDRGGIAARVAAGLLGLVALCAQGEGTDSGGGGSTPGPGSEAAPATPPGPTPPAIETGPLTPPPGMPGPYPLIEGSPYYLGASQGFTHDDNVFRTSSPKSDWISSTGIVGGLNQQIGRQRIFGAANVSYNHYFSEHSLTNTSYNLAGGLDWETVHNFSGSFGVSAGQNLAAPIQSGIVPAEHKNIATTYGANATVRWGGPSILNVEGSAGYYKVDYSAPEYVTSNSTGNYGSIGVFYHPGATLRLGIAARVTNSYTPQAAFLSTTNSYAANNVHGRNLDFIVDYTPDPFFAFNGRLSHTEQTNSGATSADFSGLTGSLSATWHATGKTSLSAYVSRDPGFSSNQFNGYRIFLIGNTPIISPVTGLYQTNQVTNSAGVGAGWQATGKVTVNGGLRYARAHLINTQVVDTIAQALPDTTDIDKVAYIGAVWSATYNWSVACTYSHELRDVSGNLNYAYRDNTIGCLAQYTWR